MGIICQLFCEDYEGRRSGAPDLFVWHVAERKCKFVEVKGPNDRPQENQKYWFDALLRAKADVELCKVIDINSHNPKKRRGKPPASARRRNAVISDDLESEEQDYEILDCENERPDGDVLQQDTEPSNKRRRISTPQPRTKADMMASTSNISCSNRTPSRVNRVVEVVLTPLRTRKI